MTPAAPDGALELFVQEFHGFEARENLFERCVDEHGFAWWDLVRYAVQYSICVEKGIFAHPRAETCSRYRKAIRLAGRTAIMLRDSLRLVSCRAAAIRQAFVFNRRTKRLLDDIAAVRGTCLLVNDTGVAAAPHIAVRKGSMDLFVRALSKLSRTSDSMAQEVARLSASLKAAFDVHADLRNLILRKYREHRAARLAWSMVLSRFPALEQIGFVGDDTLKTLVSLARERGINAREYQHGYMGRSHLNYSYPPLASRPSTLPCEVVVHRDSGDIKYPVTIVHAATFPIDDESGPERARDIDVLVGGSPTRVTEAVAIVEALAGKGLSVAVKLHPNQTPSSSGLQRFTGRQVRIYSSELDFVELARRSRVYVPANPTSTTAFEAVEHGAQLIVVDYGGTKLTSMIDGLVTRRVDSIDALYDAVQRHLPEQTAVC